MNKLLHSLLFLFSSLLASAQFPEVTIPGSEVRNIKSSIIDGQEYELHILLPGSYKNSAKKYPVVYLMDSQWDFPLVKSIYGQQYYDGFIPELMIVGITWGGLHPNPDSLRARDYTPTYEQGFPQSGGADPFLAFMNDELFPFIETNYKADKDNRVLMGCSLGGLFSLYALFTHTDMFTGYIGASPAIGWDREVLRKYEDVFAKKQTIKPVRTYITVGGVERGRTAFEKFSSDLANKSIPAFHFASTVLLNTGHSGTKSETYSRGLQYVFERPALQLPDSTIAKYAGTYKMDDHRSVELKQEGSQLVLSFSGNNQFPLQAATSKQFYSTAIFLNLTFKITNGIVEGFTLERYGNTEYLTRIH